MKKLTIALLAMAFVAASHAEDDDFQTEPMCKVEVCNKIERFSLSIWSHMKDSMGETCIDTVIPKNDAQVGNILSEESRWYQGSSINPTKKSVTRVAQVYKCQKG